MEAQTPLTLAAISQAAGARADALNFGEGAPTFAPPDIFREALETETPGCPADASPRPAAETALQAEIAAYLETWWSGAPVDPRDVLVGRGADDLLAGFLRALLRPGDRVATFAPNYLYYYATLADLGSQVGSADQVERIPLVLNGSILTFDGQALRKAITPEVKVFLLNSPQNPSAKIFTRNELEEVRRIVLENPQLVVISDEVYFNLNYTGEEFCSFARLDGMYDRTVTVFSIGKTFSGEVGPYRFGYALGPPALLQTYKDLMNLTPKPELSAETLVRLTKLLTRAKKPYLDSPCFYLWNRQRFENNLKRISAALGRLGLTVLPSDGGYFCLVDLKKSAEGRLPLSYFYSNPSKDLGTSTLACFEDWKSLPGVERTPDFAYCLYLAERHRLVLWPVSAFSDYVQTGTPLAERACTDLARVALARDEPEIARLEKFAEENLNLLL